MLPACAVRGVLLRRIRAPVQQFRQHVEHRLVKRHDLHERAEGVLAAAKRVAERVRGYRPVPLQGVEQFLVERSHRILCHVDPLRSHAATPGNDYTSGSGRARVSAPRLPFYLPSEVPLASLVPPSGMPCSWMSCAAAANSVSCCSWSLRNVRRSSACCAVRPRLTSSSFLMM